MVAWMFVVVVLLPQFAYNLYNIKLLAENHEFSTLVL